MAAVDDDILQTIGYKDASIMLECPECGLAVKFPFTVEMRMTATDNSMQIDASIFGNQINEQPLYDHMEKEHGAEG